MLQEYYPLSISQRILFFTKVFTVNSSQRKEFNIINWSFQIKGNVNIEALEESYNELIREQDSLRLQVKMTIKGPRQYILPFKYRSIPCIELDSIDSFNKNIDEYNKLINIPTNDNSLINAMIFKYPQGALLYMRCSHYCFDGFSIPLSANYLKTYYESFVVNKTPEPINQKCSIVNYLINDNAYRLSKEHDNNRKYNKKQFLSRPNYRHAIKGRKFNGIADTSAFVINGERYIKTLKYCKKIGVPISFFLESVGALTISYLTDKSCFAFMQLAQERASYFEKQTVGCMMFVFPTFYDIESNQNLDEFFRNSYIKHLDTFKHGKITPLENTLSTIRTSIRSKNLTYYGVTISAFDYLPINDEKYEYKIFPHSSLPFQTYCTISNNRSNQVDIVVDYQTKRLTKDQLDNFWKNYDSMLNKIVQREDSKQINIKDLFENNTLFK